MFVRVKVFPNSKKNGIIEKSKDSFEIRVKEKPKEGRANQAAVEILAAHLKIPKSKIRLIKGLKQRNKIFEVGIDLI